MMRYYLIRLDQSPKNAWLSGYNNQCLGPKMGGPRQRSAATKTRKEFREMQQQQQHQQQVQQQRAKHKPREGHFQVLVIVIDS